MIILGRLARLIILNITTERKERYVARHKNDHYTNPLYPSFYSTNLLWNKKTLTDSIKDTNNRFKNIY